MKEPDEIKPTILDLYANLGKDINELGHFSEKDLTYYVSRNDGTITSIRKKDIDDYIDSGDMSARKNIVEALNNFRNRNEL